MGDFWTRTGDEKSTPNPVRAGSGAATSVGLVFADMPQHVAPAKLDSYIDRIAAPTAPTAPTVMGNGTLPSGNELQRR